MKKSDEVEAYIAKAKTPFKEIMIQLRNLIAKTAPEAIENFKWGQPVYSTEKDFCYLKLNKQHVNIGFFNFEKLDDPENLLEGSGKMMRHIKIRKLSDIQAEVLSQMIAQSAKF